MTNSDFLRRFSELPAKRQALLALELQNRLEASERQQHEPVAIISMACRFPGGVNTPEAYWELLLNGVDAVSEIPPERWDVDTYYDPNPDVPGKIATRWGGFLKDVDQFDPQVFGISPREAVTMDPQQRILLEVCWEVLERGGYAPDQLNGSRAGVFVGVCNGDYYHMVTAAGGDQIDMYLATGSAHSVASGRISYLFGLQGPAISVDTACSSSLVALHMAVQSLRSGECEFALAGGVNLVLSPDTSKALSRAGMLAADGRCKAFDAHADGFVRSEGCGVLLLKPLSKAIADHDPIIAVIRGSAINQDGRSNGLTAPNGPSQEAVIRAALADARLNPADIDYVETHGTGTSLGDPIEVQALGAAYRPGRSQPLLIGSVKTNLGHLESAAGVAGLMKLALVLQHGYIPPHLHLTEPNPYIPWDQLPVHVPSGGAALAGQNGKRTGGVSSFGFSGTNAHFILESWAEQIEAASVEYERPAHLLTLSGQSEAALRDLAARWENHLAADPSLALADAAYTAGVGRAQMPYRLAVLAADTREARAKLSAYREGTPADGLFVTTSRDTRRRKLAFLFTGQGSQQVQMGRDFYVAHPVFRDAINRCDELLRNTLDLPLLSILYPEAGEASPIHEIAYAQPAQFCIEYALGMLWQSWGIIPSAVAGHSIGEYAAACTAGVFSLEDALKLVVTRGRLMQTTASGEMAAVFADEATVQNAIAPFAGSVSIAALNAPEIVVISGEKAAVAAVIEALKGQRVRAKHLEVSIAAHSPLMESITTRFAEVAAEVNYHAPEVDFYSGLTGGLVHAGEIARPEYWVRHLREAVRFAPVMQSLYDNGYRFFVEVGPAPDLLNMAQRTLPPDGISYLPSLRPGTADWVQILSSLGTLYVSGLDVDWNGFDRPYSRRRLVLPTYPFQRDRYWFTKAGHGAAAPTAVEGHPLLGQRLRSPALTDIVYQTQISANWPSFLNHHRIYDVVLLPSPAYIEMALTAAHEALNPNNSYGLEQFTIHEALVLSEDRLRTVQTILTQDGEGAHFQVLGLSDDGDSWKLYASGTVVAKAASPADVLAFQREAVQERCAETIDGAAYYERIRALGLEFGSSFQGIKQVWRRAGEALGQIILPAELTSELGQYLFHPALLDSCFHLLGAPLPDELETGYLLIGIDRFRMYRAPSARLWNHTILTDVSGETFTGDIRLYSEDGLLVAEAAGLQLKRAGQEALLRAVHRRPDDWFYQLTWEPRPQLKARAGRHAGFAALDSIEAAVLENMQRWELPSSFYAYADLAADLEDVATAFFIDALRANGVRFLSGEVIKPEALTSEQDYYQHRLIPHLFEKLVARGLLRPVGLGWQVIGDAPPFDPQERLAQLVAHYPAYQAEIDLLARCGSSLAQTLQGKIDPLTLLFPEGSSEELERIYSGSPVAQVYNSILHQVVAEAVAHHVSDQPLRVLEIGAGTGSTTTGVLEHVAGRQADYTFTDLSPLFLDRAQARFAAYPKMHYALLNIEDNPLTQGFAEGTFDLIIAANVLHATRDLGETLGHVQQLLTPGGLLVMVEGTRPQAWVDMTFGLTEGWWRFSDHEVRPRYPLLPKKGWGQLLSQTGFAGSASLDFNDASGQVVIAAQKPTEPAAAIGEREIGWLIFADENTEGAELARLLAVYNEQSMLVSRSVSTHDTDLFRVVGLNTVETQALADLLADPALASLKGIVYFGGWSRAADHNAAEAAEADSLALLELSQAVAHLGNKARPDLWVVTSGAQPLDGCVTDPAAGALWGLGRVLALEHPDWWGGLIDLDPAGPDLRPVIQELLAADGEDQVAYRHGQRHVARIIPARVTRPTAVRFAPDASYLITGGLGGLGLHIAVWMVEHGARHLTLLSRSPLPERSGWKSLPPNSDVRRRVEGVQALEALGAAVTVCHGDVSSNQQMAALFSQFGNELPPLKGIVHAAAALSNWPLAEMPRDALTSQFGAKADGVVILDQLSQDADLDFFVSFSSTTALWGVRELGHYAAANAFLDSYVYDQRARGIPALSINWGTWEAMRIASEEEQSSVAQYGLKPLPLDQALGILGDLIAGIAATAQITVASVDWKRLKPAYEARRQRPLMAYVGTVSGYETSVPAASQASSFWVQLEAALPDDRHAIIIRHIAELAAAVLGAPNPDKLDIYQGLFEMGMDSLMSVELKTRLEKNVGKTLPSTLTFNYPTISELAEYIGSKLFPENEPAGESIQRAASPEPAVSAEEVDDLSEDELAALLMKKLKNL